MENRPTVNTLQKKKRKKNSKKLTEKKVKSFRAQVNCTCNKNCAEIIDVINQKNIFDQYYGYSTWSEKTTFLRSIVQRDSVKPNLNPRMNLKKKDFYSAYYLNDASGEKQRVCSTFISKLLQLNRSKLFRAVSSIDCNPYAIDRRGKGSRNKTAAEDETFAKQFIQSFPYYESRMEPTSFDPKYLHPNLTLVTVYQLYENACDFKQKRKLPKTVFIKIFKQNMPRLQTFKPEKSTCSICQTNNTQKKIKVLSPASVENIQNQEDNHFTALKKFKSEFIDCIQKPAVGVEIFTFELQRPLPIPSLQVNETYDLRSLWLSNLCIYDELCRKANMYVWDELNAKRGPEEVGSCVFKHIIDFVSATTKKVILYCDPTNRYRNLEVIVMLAKIFDYCQNDELQSIELRFFFPGHGTNDCNHCFKTVENKVKTSYGLFTPDDWIQLISSAKEAKQSFNVQKMNCGDFLSVEILMNYLITKEIDLSDVKSIICNRAEPLNIHVKYFTRNIEEIIPMYDQKHGPYLSISNSEGLAISKAKHDDLIKKSLKYVPTDKHAYYENIPYDDSMKDIDFALASYDS